MKPYYDDGSCVIYHGDCQALELADFDWAGQMRANVLVTDPPYGVDFAGKATKHTTVKLGGYTTEDSVNLGPDVVEALLPYVERAAIFPGNRLLFRASVK